MVGESGEIGIEVQHPDLEHHIYCLACGRWIWSMESAVPQPDKFSIMCLCGARNVFKDSIQPLEAILLESREALPEDRTAYT
jgi:hypothetical protein